jgi:hypothetical protein
MAKKKVGKKHPRKTPRNSKGKDRSPVSGGFTINCDANGLIVGATGPVGDVTGFVDKIVDIKLEKTGDGVAVKTIEFQQAGEFGSCIWKLIGGSWKCI